jgi:hypothetical protein
MLNLTPNAIVLIAESGETTSIPAFGYVARVEYDRREISDQLHECRGEGSCFFIPLIEETPTEIVVMAPHLLLDDTTSVKWSWPNVWNQFPAYHNEGLLLITRDVAEAAATLKHPLAARMVWADEPVWGDPEGYGHCSACDAEYSEIIGYHSLRRVPQKGEE